MILHIFTDSPYTIRYIEFVNKTWYPYEHEFIVSTGKNSHFRTFYNNTANCHTIAGALGFLRYVNPFVTAQKVIFHQLNQPRLLLFLALFYPAVFRKSVWSMWGGDVYYHKYKTNSIIDNFNDKIMAHVIRKLPFITGYPPGDFEIIRKHYKTDAKYIKSKYPRPVGIEMVKALKTEKKQDATTFIMVGNSADPTNEHINAFAQLSKYKNEDIKVLSVLSYGGDREYVDKVIESGKSIFEEKFVPVTDYMSFEEYLNFVSSIDICYLNHKFQQGLGNLVLFLAFGKKVFVSRDVTQFGYYTAIGITLFPTEDVLNMNFDEFIQMDIQTIERNKAIIFEDESRDNIKSEWNKVFNAY